VVAGSEQVRVDLQGDAWVGVPELAADVDHIEAAGDQERCEGVAQAVDDQLAGRLESRGLDGSPETFADLAVAGCSPNGVGEHEVRGAFVAAGEVLSQAALAEGVRVALLESRLPPFGSGPLTAYPMSV